MSNVEKISLIITVSATCLIFIASVTGEYVAAFFGLGSIIAGGLILSEWKRVRKGKK